MTKSRKKVIILLSIIIVALLCLEIYFFKYTIDDSYISAKYAENLVQGKGLVFNTGERVEGYSDFMWVIYLAFMNGIGFNTLLVAKITGMIFSVLNLILIYLLTKQITKTDSAINILPVFLTASFFGYFIRAIEGLEMQLYLFFLLIAIILFIREIEQDKGYLSSVFFLLAALTRIEGVFFFAISLLFLIYHKANFSDKRNTSIRNKWKILFKKISKHNIIWFLITIIGVLSQFIWRLIYYGKLLPNSLTAKSCTIQYLYVSLLRGSYYTITFLLAINIIAVILAVLFAYKFIRKERIHILHYISILCITYIILISIQGGDWMIGFRYFTPIIPLLYIFSAPAAIYVYTILFKDTRSIIKNIIFWIIILLVLTLSALTVFNNAHILNETIASNNIYKDYSVKLKEYLQPGEYFLFYDIGAMSYYSGFNIIDSVGLVNPHIASRPGCLVNSKDEIIGSKFYYLSKFDSNYVLDRKPKIILITSNKNSTIINESSTSVISQQMLISNPRFYNEYSIKSVDNFGKMYMLVFVRNKN